MLMARILLRSGVAVLLADAAFLVAVALGRALGGAA
jgi:hypothetical protein